MTKFIVSYYESIAKGNSEAIKEGNKMNFSFLKLQTNIQFNKKKAMNFQVAALSKKQITNYFKKM